MVQHVEKRVATVRTQNTWWIDGGPRFPMGRMLEMRKREVGGKANYNKSAAAFQHSQLHQQTKCTQRWHAIHARPYKCAGCRVSIPFLSGFGLSISSIRFYIKGPLFFQRTDVVIIVQS